MKSKVAGVFMGALLSLAITGTAFAAGNSINLQVNGKTLPTDVAPIIKESRTLVPVRVISESLGADVEWNAAEQKVTVIKNDKVLELTLNSKEVLVNGSKLPELDVPPQLINNRTMVPIRVVSEALGAKVEWNGDTQTVATTIYEKRDAMTPEELMLKSNQAMAKYDTYRYTGTGKINMSSAALPQSIDMKMDLSGIYKKTGTSSEVYLVEAIEVPGMAGQAPTAIKMDVYSNGTDFYTRMEGQNWQKIDLGADFSKFMDNQDPQKAIQMMKDFGLILSYGNDVKIDGKDCYTLVVKIDTQKYLEAVRDLTSTLVPTTDPEGKKVFEELMNSMKLDMNEKVYIQKDNLMMTKVVVDGNISMTVQKMTINEDINTEMTLSGFGEPVTMPQINK